MNTTEVQTDAVTAATLPETAIHMDADKLLAMLETVLPAVEQRSAIPILRYCLIETAGGLLRLTGTDLEVAIQCGDVIDSPEARSCYDAKALRASLKAAKKMPVSLVVGKLTTPNGTCVIDTLPASEYVAIPRVTTAPESVAMFAEFGDACRYVVKAASVEESRSTLNGALVDTPNGVIVATDVYRLARRAVSIEGGRKWLIRGALARIIAKQSVRSSEALYIAHDGEQTTLTAGRVVYTQRKLTGNFPDYECVIPTRFEGAMTVDVASLKAALASIKATVDKFQPYFRFKDGAVFTDTARATFASTGDAFKGRFTWQYVMDALEGDALGVRWTTWKNKDDNKVHIGATMFGDMVVMPVRD